MSTTDDNKGFGGIGNSILYLGFILLIFHLYVFCHNVFARMGIPLGLFNNFIRALNQTTHIFDNTWLSKMIALVFMLVYFVGNKSKKNITSTWRDVWINVMPGLVLYFFNYAILGFRFMSVDVINIVYTLTTFAGYMLILRGGSLADGIINLNGFNDPFNKENESFQQETELKANEYSVNIPSLFYFKGKIHKGWVNTINPFRAALVMGTPGSGKSFAVVNNYIKQHLEKGFTMYIYDFKYPDLSTVAYHYLNKYQHTYKAQGITVPTFYTINFDDPRRSHRCNPLMSRTMTDIMDAEEAAMTIMFNLNKSWIAKKGDFFVESPIAFLAACIWYLKLYNDKKIDQERQRIPGGMDLPDEHFDYINYCTFPHVIEFANHAYDEIFPLMASIRELENKIGAFFSALKKDAADQLEGQIASARIPLGKLSSPSLYWVMTGNDFSLDINNPDEPKVLCVGNNPDRQEIYGASLGLFNARLIKLVNRKKQRKSSLIIDELPTIYFKGIDNLIATGRSNKVSTLLGLQDFSQIIRDYGDKEAKAILNTIGNIFSGQVIGESAKALSTRFGKIVQTRQSFNISEKETTTNISSQLDSLIPESKISNLSQGYFVGSVADNFGEEIEQKIFNAQLVVPQDMQEELKSPTPIPAIPELANLSDREIKKMLMDNFNTVKDEVDAIIKEELCVLRDNPVTRNRYLKGLSTLDEYYLGDPEPADVSQSGVAPGSSAYTEDDTNGQGNEGDNEQTNVKANTGEDNTNASEDNANTNDNDDDNPDDEPGYVYDDDRE